MQVGGLKGSSAAMLFSSVVDRSMVNGLFLFVLDDQDEAGYFYHDVLQALGDEHVLFFPSSYRRAIKYNQKDEANEILRTEVLTRLQARTENKVLYVVTYPDAISEKVVSERVLSDNTIPIRVGESVDLSKLERQLLDLGMQHTDYVYEPGQFAVRGSIVDVYSYSSEIPYRIDFFGDEVDSIRSFDVQTQLSKDRVQSMTIVPEMQNDATERVPLFEFLPANTVVVCHDVVYVCEKVGKIYDEGFSRQAQSTAADAEQGKD